MIIKFMDITTIVNCGTKATNNTPCTLSDLMTTTNNLATFVVVYFVPTFIIIGIVYTAIQMLYNINKPDALSKAKKNVSYILWGTFFALCAWSLMRLALNLVGWNGDIGNPLGYIWAIDIAHAAPLAGPLDNPDIVEFFKNIGQSVLVLFSVVLATTMIYLGFSFMRYSDSPDKLKEIKTRLYIAILAGFIVFSLSAIVDVLTSTFNKLDTVSKVKQKGI